MIELKPEWKFNDIQDNIEVIITQYEEFLSLFFDYQVKEKRIAIHKEREKVFGYENIMYWQREKLWETINGDFDIEEFRRLCK